MNLKELKELHDCMKGCIDRWENSDKNVELDSYLVWETGVLELYEGMISGSNTRKDFLVFAIRDMYSYIKRNEIPCASTLLVRFTKNYGFDGFVED